jgi:hypothetical protein
LMKPHHESNVSDRQIRTRCRNTLAPPAVSFMQGIWNRGGQSFEI